jgi:hypothetical protein
MEANFVPEDGICCISFCDEESANSAIEMAKGLSRTARCTCSLASGLLLKFFFVRGRCSEVSLGLVLLHFKLGVDGVVVLVGTCFALVSLAVRFCRVLVHNLAQGM